MAFKLVILEVNNRNSTLVPLESLADVLAGIVAPADIELVLEVLAGIAAEDRVIAESAVRQVYELEIMVVVKQLEARFTYLCTDFSQFCDSLLELLGIDSGTARFVHVREDDVLDTKDGVLLDNLVNIVNHLLEGNVV